MYFPSSVTREPHVSKNAYHVVTYGAPQTLSCKYQSLSEKILDKNGEETLISAWLMFPASTSLNYDDRITLPDGSKPNIAKIMHINNHMGQEVCVEVFLTNDQGFK